MTFHDLKKKKKKSEYLPFGVQLYGIKTIKNLTLWNIELSLVFLHSDLMIVIMIVIPA